MKHNEHRFNDMWNDIKKSIRGGKKHIFEEI